MRMTIDESLQMVKDGRIVAISISGSDLDVSKYNQENIEALNTIVKTVYKYQKIEEIMNREYIPLDSKFCLPQKFLPQKLVDIMKVIEDGNEN